MTELLTTYLFIYDIHLLQIPKPVLYVEYISRFLFLPFVFSSTIGDGLGEGYGMLGQAGSGKLRVSIGQSKLAAKVAKK